MELIDNKTVFNYIPKSDRGLRESDQTTFFLKILTVRSGTDVKSLMYDYRRNEAYIKALEYSLIGWDNLKYGNKRQARFDNKNFYKNIRRLNYNTLEELAEFIIERSSVDENLEKNLKILTRFSEYCINKKINKEIWDCNKCIERKDNIRRNCDGSKDYSKERINIDKYSFKGKKNKDNKTNRIILRIGTLELKECPIKHISFTTQFLINIVSWCDGNNLLPAKGSLLNQTWFFYEARSIILSEREYYRNEIEKEDDNSTSQRGIDKDNIIKNKSNRLRAV